MRVKKINDSTKSIEFTIELNKDGNDIFEFLELLESSRFGFSDRRSRTFLKLNQSKFLCSLEEFLRNGKMDS